LNISPIRPRNRKSCQAGREDRCSRFSLPPWLLRSFNCSTQRKARRPQPSKQQVSTTPALSRIAQKSSSEQYENPAKIAGFGREDALHTGALTTPMCRLVCLLTPGRESHFQIHRQAVVANLPRSSMPASPYLAIPRTEANQGVSSWIVVRSSRRVKH
jgi:hypothetical protein